jgi:hypothetical protein
MVLCIVRNKLLVQVFWVFEPNQNERFSVEAAIAMACFTPDNRSVLVALSSSVSLILFSI